MNGRTLFGAEAQLECAACGEPLDWLRLTVPDGPDRIVVYPCQTCLSEAWEEGEEAGYCEAGGLPERRI